VTGKIELPCRFRHHEPAYGLDRLEPDEMFRTCCHVLREADDAPCHGRRLGNERLGVDLDAARCPRDRRAAAASAAASRKSASSRAIRASRARTSTTPGANRASSSGSSS
jgi:hypothetical protein